jgi:hypothetical protein
MFWNHQFTFGGIKSTAFPSLHFVSPATVSERWWRSEEEKKHDLEVRSEYHGSYYPPNNVE